MTITSAVVNTTIRGLTRLLCRVYDDQLPRIPETGPLILVSNHINFLEVPLLYTHLQPRPVTGFAKAETWDNPALRILFNLWGGIPIRRGVADILALRQGLEMLEKGYILAVAPEGTRSHYGHLQRGHPGIALLALHSGAPVLPLAYYGGELLRHNLARLRRTDFRILVGRPFTVDAGEARITRQVRQDITDQIMYQLAALLPRPYRGIYYDLEKASQVYLRFIAP
jgi:1-acyl-sn-glycerol-3-phosphate acyltransferase